MKSKRQRMSCVILFWLALTLLGSLGTFNSTASAQTGVWVPTGSMTTPRTIHTATLLPNGKVLVVGGCANSTCSPVLSSAELFDPGTATWTPTGSMTTARTGHTATLLPSGKILVAGGQSQRTESAISSAELYDPDTGAWTPTGSMSTPRVAHVASLITSGPLSGKVLVAGGSSVCRGCTPLLSSAELYDPSTGTWSLTGSMTLARYWDDRSPVTLPDGLVLVVGGDTCCPYQWFNSAESYNPVTQTWTRTRDKTTPAQGAAVLMSNGQVLVAGGGIGTQPLVRFVAAAELFEPTTGTWTATGSMSIDRNYHTLTLLRSGEVLVAGGASGGWSVCNTLTSTELYDSSTGRWYPAGNMTVARTHHTATPLPNGQVLVAGGGNCANQVLSSAELYVEVQSLFRPAVNYNVGDGPSSVATGDFSGDGILDLVVANAGSNSVSILPGDGDGTFQQPKANFVVGTSPQSVAVGDFNRDGLLDIVTANRGSNNVTVLFGLGDLRFITASFRVGAEPSSVAVGDFNGDGWLDLAVANRAGNTVSLLLGNPFTVFWPAIHFDVGLGPRFVAVGDLNGDGIPDLVTANAGSNNVTVLLGNGDGSFQTGRNYRVGASPVSVALGDFDGDGVLDLAVANQNSNNVSVLLGHGDGTFQAAVNYATGSGPSHVAVADFDGDGIPDLAVANQTSNQVNVMPGHGDGTFETLAYLDRTGTRPVHMAVADFDGDGKPDLAVANAGSNNVSILINNTSPPKAPANWPQYGFNPQNTRFNPYETTLNPKNVSQLRMSWRTGFGCSIYTSPAVVDGVVYAGTYCGDFYAFEASTGRTLWRRDIDGAVADPTVANGVVYIGARNRGMLHAFNASSGATLWTATTGGNIYHNMATVVDGVVYVGAGDGRLYAFDAGTGATRWMAAAGRELVHSVPAVADGVVYVESDQLYAFDAKTGATLWTATTGGGNDTSLAVADGIVYVESGDGRLYAFDASGCGKSSCSPLWSTRLTGGSSPGLSVANGIIYLGSWSESKVYAYDVSQCAKGSCSPLWTATTSGATECAPAVANGVVYAGSNDSVLYAFNAATGATLWQQRIGGTVPRFSSCPSVVNGALYAGVTFNFALYKFHLPEPTP